jgi:hypothetical protein
VLFRNVAITRARNYSFDLEELPNIRSFEPSGVNFRVGFALEPNWTYDNATLEINFCDYVDKINNENNLKLFRCPNYNFFRRSCPNWVLLGNATVNTTTKILSLVISGFSAYAIGEDEPTTTVTTSTSTSGGGGGGSSIRRSYITECNDGIDNDDDGTIDYAGNKSLGFPADPDCNKDWKTKSEGQPCKKNITWKNWTECVNGSQKRVGYEKNCYSLRNKVFNEKRKCTVVQNYENKSQITEKNNVPLTNDKKIRFIKELIIILTIIVITILVTLGFKTKILKKKR